MKAMTMMPSTYAGAGRWCGTVTRGIEPSASSVMNWVPILISTFNHRVPVRVYLAIWVLIPACFLNCTVLVLKMCHFEANQNE